MCSVIFCAFPSSSSFSLLALLLLLPLVRLSAQQACNCVSDSDSASDCVQYFRFVAHSPTPDPCSPLGLCFMFVLAKCSEKNS